MYTIDEVKQALDQKYEIEKQIKEFYRDVREQCSEMYEAMNYVKSTDDDGNCIVTTLGTAAERCTLDEYSGKMSDARERFWKSDADYAEIALEYIEHLKKKYF